MQCPQALIQQHSSQTPLIHVSDVVARIRTLINKFAQYAININISTVQGGLVVVTIGAAVAGLVIKSSSFLVRLSSQYLHESLFGFGSWIINKISHYAPSCIFDFSTYVITSIAASCSLVGVTFTQAQCNNRRQIDRNEVCVERKKSQTHIHNLTTKLSSLKIKIEGLETELAATKSTTTYTQVQITLMEKTIVTLNKEKADLIKELSDCAAQLNKKQSQPVNPHNNRGNPPAAQVAPVVNPVPVPQPAPAPLQSPGRNGIFPPVSQNIKPPTPNAPVEKPKI